MRQKGTKQDPRTQFEKDILYPKSNDGEIDGYAITLPGSAITIHPHHGWDPERDSFRVAVFDETGDTKLAEHVFTNRDDHWDVSGAVSRGKTYAIHVAYRNNGGGLDCRIEASSQDDETKALAYAHGHDWTAQFHQVWCSLTLR